MDQSVIKPQVQNVTKCNVSHFYALSEILNERCPFEVPCQFNAKSGAIDQLTPGDRPVDRDRRVATPAVW